MTAPILRFKDQGRSYPDWVQKKLKDCVTFSKGGSLSKSDLSPHGATPCLLYGELYTTYGEVTKAVINKTDSTEDLVKSQMNDVILPMSGETAEDIAKATCIKQEGVAYGGDLMVLRSKSLDGCFLSYSLNSINRRQISRIAQGKTVVHINPSRVSDISINVACLEEQQKIASFFSIFDEKISITEKRIELFLNLKKWLMIKIFSREIRFKDENNSYYPEWCVKRLGDIATLKNGIAKSKSFFGHGSKFVNLQDVFCKSRLYNSSFGLVEVTEKELRENNLQKGDVLFVRSSVKPEGVGLPCLVEQDLDATTFSGFLIRCRFNATELTDSFKIHLFNSYTFRNEVLRRSTVSANTNINQDNLSIIPVAIPCKEEQKKISTLLDAIDDRIDLSIKKLNKIKTIKRGLLQAMFV